MRVAFYDSFFLPVVGALRELGVDAHLYVDRRDVALQAALRDEASLEREPWVHVDAYVTKATLLRPKRSALVGELAGYDAVVTAGVGPVFAQFTSRPFSFLPAGGDLTVTPFPHRGHLEPWRSRASSAPTAYWQRRGIRAAKRVWAAPWAPFRLALARIGAGGPHRYLPVAVDVDHFTGSRPAPEGWPTSGVRVLHPSRLIIRPLPRLVETGHWKGNDVLIDGIADHVAAGGDSALVLIDRPQSPDVELARSLLAARGIEDRTTWLRHPSGLGYSWEDLPALYGAADVVADDFGVGWFGLVTLEGLAAGRPVLTYVEPSVMDALYPDHPLVLARTPTEVAAQLERLADADERARIGEAGRRWVIQHHAAPAVARQYVEAIDDLLHGD
jgi:glycosyltransferase involved in cell wall biosynthesis